jgi:hypothetical protein
MNITDVIYYILASLNLVYELPEDGRDVPKHVGVVNGHADASCHMRILFGFINEQFNQNARNK